MTQPARKSPGEDRPACVAVIDDLATTRAIVGHVMREALHCDVASFDDAKDALGWLSEHECALVVADYRMPGMDGLEFAEQALRLKKGLPIVLLTVHEIAEIEARASALGVKTCLSKGCGHKELLACAARLLGVNLEIRRDD